MTIHISTAFDAGAVEVIAIEPVPALESAGPAAVIRLNLPRDSHADFRQWFYFKLQGARGVRCVLRFENTAHSAYPDGWPGYQAVMSSDRCTWSRVKDTRHVDGMLEVSITPDCDAVYLAYFEPYPWDRHLDLLARVGACPGVRVRRLGQTVDGRDMDLVQVGDAGPQKRRIWVIARQHPGETMAEWFVEGLLDRLLDTGDTLSRQLLDHATFYVVPNMNPDGSVRGNLRTNAAGANLNRAWLSPSLESSPEVLCVRTAMHQIGVDAFLDVHGDESLPYVFIDGSWMLPHRSDANIQRERAFLAAVKAACPDFQTEVGYAANRFSEELYTLASKYVAREFGCLSVTLEMPFKDNANRPDAQFGWSAQRSRELGAQMLNAFWADTATPAR